MKIFPAIDIKDKKCVRLIKGDFENKTEYETSPVDQAGKYKDHGFKNLHIVDLDGALTGKTVNLELIKQIISKYDFVIKREKNKSISSPKYLSTMLPCTNLNYKILKKNENINWNDFGYSTPNNKFKFDVYFSGSLTSKKRI